MKTQIITSAKRVQFESEFVTQVMNEFIQHVRPNEAEPFTLIDLESDPNDAGYSFMGFIPIDLEDENLPQHIQDHFTREYVSSLSHDADLLFTLTLDYTNDRVILIFTFCS